MTTSRLSYASSPESDLELGPGPSTSLSLGNLPQLVKSSSDPSIATNQDNLDRDREEMVDGIPPPYTVSRHETATNSRFFTFSIFQCLHFIVHVDAFYHILSLTMFLGEDIDEIFKISDFKQMVNG